MRNVLKIPKSETQVKREQRQAKLTIVADKRARGQLKLEDIDDKLNIVIEMVEELLQK